MKKLLRRLVVILLGFAFGMAATRLIVDAIGWAR